MVELVFILSDFFGTPPPSAALPRLPALEQLLAHARPARLSDGWRSWLAAQYALDALPPNVAQVAAAAWPGPSAPRPQSWLATPVHYFAGLDSVQLHPAGLLTLRAAEQAALVADFARVFEGSDWQLRSLGQRELLLSGAPLEGGGADPARFAGADPSPGMPQGAAAGALRRLGSEVEMWLHQHALNRARQARAELPVSTLWFWNEPIRARAPRREHAPLRLFGADTVAAALSRQAAATLAALPAALDRVREVPAGTLVVIYPGLQDAGLVHTFTDFELAWLAPALQALRSRQLAGVQLLFGTRWLRLRRLDRWRLWRTVRPWWQALQ